MDHENSVIILFAKCRLLQATEFTSYLPPDMSLSYYQRYTSCNPPRTMRTLWSYCLLNVDFFRPPSSPATCHQTCPLATIRDTLAATHHGPWELCLLESWASWPFWKFWNGAGGSGYCFCDQGQCQLCTHTVPPSPPPNTLMPKFGLSNPNKVIRQNMSEVKKWGIPVWPV